MIQYLFEHDIISYIFAGMCGLGLLVRLIVNLLYKNLLKESDSPSETKNKMVKHLKLKFETCYKLKIGVNNVDTFVDKNVLKYRFCGILLSTWDNFCGQVLFLILLLVPICAVFGTILQCGKDQVLRTGAVGLLASAVLIFVDKSINITNKKRMLRLNLLDYLENFCKVRLEQEAFHPELLEQYRREYLQVTESGKQISATAAALKEEPKDELNRRREIRLKKEQERRIQAIKREEEQKRMEEARREEEKRKIEERRLLAAKRREEELLKLEEEKQSLEARRAEIKKKADEKQQSNVRKQLPIEKEKILHNREKEHKAIEDTTDVDMLLQGLQEIETDRENNPWDRENNPRNRENNPQDRENNSWDRENNPRNRENDLLNQKNDLLNQKNDLLNQENDVLHQKNDPLNRENPLLEQSQDQRKEKRIELQEKDKLQKSVVKKQKKQGMSPQEEKLIEDVLKEFFA